MPYVYEIGEEVILLSIPNPIPPTFQTVTEYALASGAGRVVSTGFAPPTRTFTPLESRSPEVRARRLGAGEDRECA